MRTSNFRVSGADPEAVAISRGLPRFQPFRGFRYPDLAPTFKMLKMPREAYDKEFDLILARLDPRRVHDDLLERFGPDPILLCFEPPGIWCHRRRVAEWFETELGIVVPEVGVDRKDTIAYAEMPAQVDAKKKAGTKLLSLFGLVF